MFVISNIANYIDKGNCFYIYNEIIAVPQQEVIHIEQSREK